MSLNRDSALIYYTLNLPTTGTLPEVAEHVARDGQTYRVVARVPNERRSRVQWKCPTCQGWFGIGRIDQHLKRRDHQHDSESICVCPKCLGVK